MSTNLYYSDEKNVQILVALLKAKKIKRVIASPGTTNINFVWSVQRDPFFEVFSAVDERHAAYLACGMAGESGEPVVLTCTGATASRNYFPGLTEAYYRKLPILAVTAMQRFTRVGNLTPQALDRSTPPQDAIKYSLQCPIPYDETTTKACELNLNKALIELTRHGGGPVHINLETSYSASFSTQELPAVREISYLTAEATEWPSLPASGKLAIWIGAHKPFTAEETGILEAFALAYQAVVFVDHTSGYAGKYAIHSAFLASIGIGRNSDYSHLLPTHLIHIGEVSGDYPTNGLCNCVNRVWRVSEDGELKDLLGKLTAVFEMKETTFFRHYTGEGTAETNVYAEAWAQADATFRAKIPELPFSNPWIAQQLAPQIPQDTTVHLGILNSLRSWNLFPLSQGVASSCNVGGFGIDGIVSTLIGASLLRPDKTFLAVVGDLAFFYDLNALGNRHLGKNVRILLINNASGAEFHLYNHPAYKFKEHTGAFMAADGHYGNRSPELVKHYATDLGLTYLAATDKASFLEQLPAFLGESDRSIVLECFTTPEDESQAHQLINTMVPPPRSAREVASKVLPTGVKSILKKVIK